VADLEIDDTGRELTKHIAAWKSYPGANGECLYDRVRERWRNDWWMRYLHEITKEGRTEPPPPPPARAEWEAWIQWDCDRTWLGDQIIEWARVQKGKLVWEILGDLKEIRYEPPYSSQTLSIWEGVTEAGKATGTVEKPELNAFNKTLAAIQRHNAASDQRYVTFFGNVAGDGTRSKLSDCWSPSTRRQLSVL
jgi:hypothetical protein